MSKGHTPAKTEKKEPQHPSGKAPKTMYVPSPGGCLSWGCKVASARFGFCHEHYDYFKFGLIKKNGEPVPDYEKKIEHYLALKAREKAIKVA